MRLENLLHTHSGVIQPAIGGVGRGSAAAGLRYIGLRTCGKVPCDVQQPPLKAPVAQPDGAKLLLRPILRRARWPGRAARRRPLTRSRLAPEDLAEIFVQGQQVDPLRRAAVAVLTILAPPPAASAHPLPVRPPRPRAPI